MVSVHMDDEVVFLRYQWIDCLRSRGAMLENLSPCVFSSLIDQQKISPVEAILCIRLNRHLNGYSWHDYKAILVWWHERGEALPSTPHDVVRMLGKWQDCRH